MKKINTKRLKNRGPDKPSGPPVTRSTSATTVSVKDLPWYGLFRDRGYSDHSIPTINPPAGNSYVKIEDWVTRDQWILEQDEDLAMDIWLKRVDPYNYIRQEPKPAPKTSPSEGACSDSGSPKKKNGTSGGTFKRLGKRRKSASATSHPTGP